MTNTERVQGLTDLYFKAGKSRNAVGAMAEYLKLQGLLSDEDMTALSDAIDAQDAQGEPLDLKAALRERDELKVQVESIASERDELAAQNIALQEQVEVASVSIGGGKILAQ